MENKILLPDYKNCVLNLTASLKKVFNLDSDYQLLADLDIDALRRKKNLILIILDGLGVNLINRFAKDSFLGKNLFKQITTVFPPTTAAAMTSIYTGKSPLEHGAIGWALYFKEFFKLIDFLPCNDHVNSAKLDYQKAYIYSLFQHRSFLNDLAKITKTHYLTPKYISKSKFSRKLMTEIEILPYGNVNSMLKTVANLTGKSEQKFILAYSTLPDSLEHKFGVYDERVHDFVKKIEYKIFQLSQNISDSTILISSDHGMKDVNHYFSINDDKNLYESLILPTFPEPRFVSFFVKNHKRKQFEHAIEKYRQDFYVLKREEFLAKNLLGKGQAHKKIDDFIGDYLAIAIGDKAFETNYWQNLTEEDKMKAHHSGLTKDEMLVPLIKIDV